MPPDILGSIGVALIFGIALGYYLRYLHALSQKSSLELDIKGKTLEAEEKAIKVIEKAEEKAEKIEQEARAAQKVIEEKLKVFVGKEGVEE